MFSVFVFFFFHPRLRQTVDVNLYRVSKFSPYFPFTLHCFYTKISSFMPVLTIGIVPDCFYLLIFYSEKFWRLPFAVNVNLNLSNYQRTSTVYFVLGILKMDLWNLQAPTTLIFYSTLLPHSLIEKVLFSYPINLYLFHIRTYKHCIPKFF